MKKTVAEYKNFAMKGNILDMAIGVVIGSAFTNIVNTLVSSTITPIISVLTNKVDLSTLYISLDGKKYSSLIEAKQAGAIVLQYGELLNAIFNFIIISVTLFIVIKIMNNNKRKNVENVEEVKKETTKECQYCKSTIPITATKCAYCTSDLSENIEEESLTDE